MLSINPPPPSSHLNPNTFSFFPLFGSFIYRLTDDAASVSFATQAVLEYFASEGCIYLELRTTPREVPRTGLTLAGYVDAVRAGFASFAGGDRMKAKLLLSVDRRHSVEMAEKVVDLALRNRDLVVGVDVCGDPTKGDARGFMDAFARAREGGLGVTVHLGEVSLSEFMIRGKGNVLKTLEDSWSPNWKRRRTTFCSAPTDSGTRPSSRSRRNGTSSNTSFR